MLNFSHMEIAYTIIGYLTPFFLYTTLAYLKENQRQDYPWVGDLITNIFLLCSNTVIYIGVFLFNNKYIHRYISREDDLIGQTDTLRRIIREKQHYGGFQNYFWMFVELLLPCSMLLLNNVLLSLETKFFRLFTKYDNDSNQTYFMIYSLSNFSGLVGALLFLFLPTANYLIIGMGLILRTALFVCIVIENLREENLFDNKYVWMSSICFSNMLHYFMQGCLLYAGASRTEDKFKKNAGFVMFFCIMIGVSYGELANAASFTKSSKL